MSFKPGFLPSRHYSFGDIESYTVDDTGLPHSVDDMPAITFKNGVKQYYQHGKLHRDGDKPAVI